MLDSLPLPPTDVPALATLLRGIRSRADALDRTGDWPEADLRALADIGAMRWAVPHLLGGDDLSALDIHLRYETIAAVSLSTALILSQRDSAVGLIDGCENELLRGELLPSLAINEIFSTVGIAHLTTSRQGAAPALVATPVDGGYRLDGAIPWATGADHCDFIVAGSVVEGAVNDVAAKQMLFILPTDLPGVTVEPPMPLVALASSRTSSLRCDGVKLCSRWVLSGPGERALTTRKKALPIGQSFLAMGLCRSALNLIAGHDSDRARQTHDRLSDQLLHLRERVLNFCNPATTPDADEAPRLRGACNDLAVRITHAAVALYKGTALLAGHPAQRLAREAMFLLVWSCPDPVIQCTVELLSDPAVANSKTAG